MSTEGQDRGQRFDEIARTVRNRDAGRCRRCQRAEGEVRLSVHHLIPDVEIPEDIDSHLPVNLVSLCRECHGQLESEPLFRQLLEIDVDQHEQLMLSEDTRRKLNNRLANIGPDILNTKKVSEEEALGFINQLSVSGSEQRTIDDF